MRRILLNTLMMSLTYSFYSQQKILVSQPEYRVLYTHYDNKIECLSNVSDSIYISTKNPSDAQILFVKDRLGSDPYFIVRPLIHDSLILDFHTITGGVDEIIESEEFSVKIFPKPEVQNGFLSKSYVNEIEIAYPTYFPIKKEFSVIGGICVIKDTEYPFIGNRIPGNLLSKAKNGSKVIIEVTIKIEGEASPILITSALSVAD
jgi:hypothetical protein